MKPSVWEDGVLVGMDWATIIYLVAFLGGMAQFHMATRRKMMTVRVLNGFLFILYFYMLGANTAVAACGIATLGAFFQAVFPDHMLERTRLLRTGAAVTLALFGCFAYAGSAADMLPLIAVAGARIIETFSCQQKIRLGLLGAQHSWLIYHIGQGFHLAALAETLFIISNLSSIWRYEQERKKSGFVSLRA